MAGLAMTDKVEEACQCALELREFLPVIIWRWHGDSLSHISRDHAEEDLRYLVHCTKYLRLGTRIDSDWGFNRRGISIQPIIAACYHKIIDVTVAAILSINRVSDANTMVCRFHELKFYRLISMLGFLTTTSGLRKALPDARLYCVLRAIPKPLSNLSLVFIAL